MPSAVELSPFYALYRHDPEFVKQVNLLMKNDDEYFTKCKTSCTEIVNDATGESKPVKMMAVKAKKRISQLKKVKFGLHWGRFVTTSDYEEFKDTEYMPYTISMRVLPIGETHKLLVAFECLGAFVNSASSLYPKTRYQNKKPEQKVTLRAALKWPGFFYYETDGFAIHEGEEVFTLYTAEGDKSGAAGDDDLYQATRVRLTQDDISDDDEDDDPSVTPSQL